MRGLRDLDLNLLVVFQAIYQERHISRAARRLALSQPAVSNALARLRRTFGDELFVRTGQGMMPTPLSSHLAGQVSAALDGIVYALRHEEDFDPAFSDRQFTISMSDVGEVYFLPTLAQRCAEAAPGVSLRTVRVAPQDLREEMAAGRVDIAIGAYEHPADAFFQRRLFRQSYVSLFRQGHALSDGLVTRATFVAARHLFVSDPEDPYVRLNTRLEKAGIRAAVKVSVPNLIAVPFIVCATDLVVTVPRKFAERVAEPFGLCFARPPIALPMLQTYAFWHRRFHQDAGIQWLRGQVAEMFSE
jgi:DNA-binding transcriptional LysR family regulator